MSTDMVRANLLRLKTETRRTRGLEVVNDKPDVWKSVGNSEDIFHFDHINKKKRLTVDFKSPYGKPGDLLYVRESWERNLKFPEESWIPEYRHKCGYPEPSEFVNLNWRPSIQMPKDAARIWLHVEEIKVERLQGITGSSAIAEGIEPSGNNNGFKNYLKVGPPVLPAFWSFNSLWCSINGSESWNLNPWVWVVKYRILSTTGRPIRACRVCGCTEDNCIQCIKKTGMPCYWVEYDLCSACTQSKKRPARQSLSMLLNPKQ